MSAIVAGGGSSRKRSRTDASSSLPPFVVAIVGPYTVPSRTPNLIVDMLPHELLMIVMSHVPPAEARRQRLALVCSAFHKVRPPPHTAVSRTPCWR